MVRYNQLEQDIVVENEYKSVQPATTKNKGAASTKNQDGQIESPKRAYSPTSFSGQYVKSKKLKNDTNKMNDFALHLYTKENFPEK